MSTSDPDGEGDVDRLLDELTLDPNLVTPGDIQRFARGLERADAMLPAQPERKALPPDLQALYSQIREAAFLREALFPDAPPVAFEGFEALAARRGGMGLVIRARDPSLERTVAIKLWLKPGFDAEQALLAEARTLAKLSHRNVVPIYATGRWGERVFFVMEWIDGVDGHEWMEELRPWREVRDVFVLAGDGLGAAHEVGIQHRDFKPSNLLISNEGRVLVADFGIADSLEEVDGEESDEAYIVGTISYMAPERLRGERGDARSDQFSFCVALWRGLYGVRPFAGGTREELLEAIGTGRRRMDPSVEVPEWLAATVARGLAEDPEQRWADMQELVDALLDEPPEEPSLEDEEVWTAPPGGRSSSPVRHSPTWVAFALGAVVTCVGLLGAMSWAPSDPPVVGSTAPALPSAAQAPVEQPCAAVEGLPGVVEDPTVLEVCELIRDGHLQAADLLWGDHMNRVLSAESSETLYVAATYVEHSETMLNVDPEVARAAARKAVVWLLMAAAPTAKHQEAITRLRTRADRIRSKVEALSD